MNGINREPSDVIGDLEIYSSSSLSSSSNNEGDERGCVYYKGNLFFKEFPFCKSLKEVDEIDELAGEGMYYYAALEGTLIRVFFVDGLWFTSTTRRLDAYASMWGRRWSDNFIRNINNRVNNDESQLVPNLRVKQKRSFGEQFEIEMKKLYPTEYDLISIYNKYLDKSKRYVFMLMASEEDRHVCKSSDDGERIKLLGVFDDANELLIDGTRDESVSIGIPLHDMKKLATESDVETAKDFYNKMSADDYQGLHFFDVVAKKAYKMYLPEYERLRAVRNNEPDLNKRYFQLRTSKNQDMRITFFDIFPEMRVKANIIEEGCYKLCEMLNDFYTRKYRTNSPTFNPVFSRKPIFQDVVGLIHSQFVLDKVETTPSKINNMLTERPGLFYELVESFYYSARNFELHQQLA